MGLKIQKNPPCLWHGKDLKKMDVIWASLRDDIHRHLRLAVKVMEYWNLWKNLDGAMCQD